MSVPAYPLRWPANRKRKHIGGALSGNFKANGNPVSISVAVGRLQDELDRLGAKHPVISSNIELRLDGLPRSNQAEPADRGVAVYFQLDGKPHCMPCDTFTSVAQNIAAVAAHINATRAIKRYGVATVAEMFTGFQQLPAHGQADSQQWRNVLGFGPIDFVSEIDIQARYRSLAKERSGVEVALKELNVARATKR